MHRLWLIFAQAATVAVAVVFVVTTFRPEWLPTRGTQVAVVQQAPTTGPLPTAVSVGSYHEAVQRAAPSVVNIFTSRKSARRAIRYSTIQRSGASSAISYPTNRSAPPASDPGSS